MGIISEIKGTISEEQEILMKSSEIATYFNWCYNGDHSREI